MDWKYDDHVHPVTAGTYEWHRQLKLRRLLAREMKRRKGTNELA